MKQLIADSLRLALLALSLLVISASAQDTATGGETPTREDLILVEARATVTSIDLEKRKVTLEGDLGNTTTITVAEEVERLGEVEVGDEVVANYYISVVYELREPTEQELAEPLQVLGNAGRSDTDMPPAAAAAAQIRAVCTIEVLDRPNSTATVQGPLGNFHTVKVMEPKVFPELRIGQPVVITYTEAVAVSLEKAAPTDG